MPEMDSKATIAPANSEYAKRLTTIANALATISTVSR